MGLRWNDRVINDPTQICYVSNDVWRVVLLWTVNYLVIVLLVNFGSQKDHSNDLMISLVATVVLLLGAFAARFYERTAKIDLLASDLTIRTKRPFRRESEERYSLSEFEYLCVSDNWTNGDGALSLVRSDNSYVILTHSKIDNESERLSRLLKLPVRYLDGLPHRKKTVDSS